MKRNKEKIKQEKRARRAYRTRARIKGTAEVPRLSVFRSLRHISAQLIDDSSGKTLVSASDSKLGSKGKGTKVDSAQKVGKALARSALEKNIKKVIFDRGSYRYHGRVKALAEGAREGGLKF